MAGTNRQTTRGATIVKVVALLCWVAFIWGNSLVPATDSAARSGTVAQLVSPLFGLLGVSDVAQVDHIVRKTAHFLEYAVLGALSVIALGPAREGRRTWPTVVVGVAVPSIDESIQLFVPGRSGQVSDVLLDMTGFATGALVTSACLSARKRRRERRSGGERG